jgi:hypothetical protein
MDELTSRERISAALAGQAIDRLPFSPFLAYVWEHFPKEVQDRGQLAFLEDVGADPLWRGAPCPVQANCPGTEVITAEDAKHTLQRIVTPVGELQAVWVKSETGNTAFLHEHPLKTEADYKVQLWITEHTELVVDMEPVKAHLQGDGRAGLSVGMLLPRGKTAFQSLIEHHAGTVELVYALNDFSDTVETLLAAMVDVDLRAARMVVDSPYDWFISWEDSSTTNYSPALYRRYIAPEIRSLCDIVGGQGKHYMQHACGHVRSLLPLMVEQGVGAVESLVHPPTGNVSLREARAMLGKNVGIVGGIEPTRFLELTPLELEAYVEQVVADCGGGPHLLANSDSCPPGVTRDKFVLVSQIVRRLGAR